MRLERRVGRVGFDRHWDLGRAARDERLYDGPPYQAQGRMESPESRNTTAAGV